MIFVKWYLYLLGILNNATVHHTSFVVPYFPWEKHRFHTTNAMVIVMNL